MASRYIVLAYSQTDELHLVYIFFFSCLLARKADECTQRHIEATRPSHLMLTDSELDLNNSDSNGRTVSMFSFFLVELLSRDAPGIFVVLSSGPSLVWLLHRHRA